MRTVLKILGTGVLLIVAVLFVFGWLLTTGYVPDSKVVSGDTLSASVIEDLRDEGIIDGDERIKYFYSEDLFSFVNYGNLYTDRHVISYEIDSDTNTRNIYSAKFADKSDLQFLESEEVFSDSIIDVYVNGEVEFSLVVSNEEGGDETFFNSLERFWQNKLSASSP